MTIPQTAKEIILSLPHRFRKEKSTDANFQTIFHFQIDGEEGGEFTIRIHAAEIEVREGLHDEATCVIKTKASTYSDIEWERENPQMAFMWGKIKVSNISEMMTFAGMFRSLKKTYHPQQ